MNTSQATVRGSVQRVQFNGAGQNSGEIGISLSNHQSYWVFMDTPPNEFCEIFKTAITAMWGNKTVEITYVPKNNDWGVVSIRIVGD